MTMEQVRSVTRDELSIAPDAFLPDGTPLYFKTGIRTENCPAQLALYALLMKKETNK